MQEDNPYIFGDTATDRYRLETQTRLFSDYVRENARRLVGDNVHSILDLGCGEGQLGLVLREIYPEARLVGIDKDEKAIAVAQSKATGLGISNVEYIVGDIEQELPTGPFDLVYASVVLVHTRNPQRISELVYQALRPSGHFWVKDLDAQAIQQASELASYRKVATMFFDTIARIGAHPYVAIELPQMLPELGFVDLHEESEVYPLGGNTDAGRTMLAITMGAAYNARGLISKVMSVTEAEVTQLYLDVINAAVLSAQKLGEERLFNLVARKPV